MNLAASLLKINYLSAHNLAICGNLVEGAMCKDCEAQYFRRTRAVRSSALDVSLFIAHGRHAHVKHARACQCLIGMSVSDVSLARLQANGRPHLQLVHATQWFCTHYPDARRSEATEGPIAVALQVLGLQGTPVIWHVLKSKCWLNGLVNFLSLSPVTWPPLVLGPHVPSFLAFWLLPVTAINGRTFPARHFTS